nr:MAG TPA: hypothetical protein [Herelleviridae sp.]
MNQTSFVSGVSFLGRLSHNRFLQIQVISNYSHFYFGGQGRHPGNSSSGCQGRHPVNAEMSMSLVTLCAFYTVRTQQLIPDLKQAMSGHP